MRETAFLRGQSSVEFFLVIAFSFVLAAALMSSGDVQLRNLSALQRAAVAKASMDTIATMANQVYIQGGQARQVNEVFIPYGSACFFPVVTSGGQPVLQCDVDPVFKGRVNSIGLFAVPGMSNCPINTQDYGWFRVLVANNESANQPEVSIDCQPG